MRRLHRLLKLFVLPAVVFGCVHKKPKLDPDVIMRELQKPFQGGSPLIPDSYIDPLLTPFLNEYLADTQNYQVKVTSDALNMLRRIEFVDTLTDATEENIIASCVKFTSTGSGGLFQSTQQVVYTSIEVLRPDFLSFISSDWTKTPGYKVDVTKLDDPTNSKERYWAKEVLYHELTHCLLDKGHNPNHEGIMSAALVKGARNVVDPTGFTNLVHQLFSNTYLDILPNI